MSVPTRADVGLEMLTLEGRPYASATKSPIAIRDIVRSRFITDPDAMRGIVTAMETYTTDAGTSHYAYVRWIEKNGRPADQSVRVETWELVKENP